MSSPLSGITQDTIGTAYDLAIGWDNGSTIKMVGYVLKPGSQWAENTDIQDETSLVQISSGNATDRFTRYPKVSQGDWSGGARQQFYETTNKYYTSDGSVNATVPGQLQLLGPITSLTFLDAGLGGRVHAPIASDGSLLYIGHQNDATHNIQISVSTNDVTSSFTAYVVGDGSRILDLLGDSVYNQEGVFVALTNGGGATNGILQINGTGGTVAQMTNDAVCQVAVPAMCSFNANLFYATAANAIRYVPFATPAGNASGTLYYTLPVNEGVCTSIFSTGTFIIFTTENGATAVGIGNQTVIWSADGVNTPTRLGVIPGRVRGGGQVNGIVYLIVYLNNNFEPFGSNSTLPEGVAIYQVDGTVITVFDDYRSLDPVFQANVQVAVETAGSCVGDGRFMFVTIPGLPMQVYDMVTQGNPVFQYGVTSNGEGVLPLAFRVIAPLNGAGSGPVSVRFDGSALTTTVSQVVLEQTGWNGEITLSWMDFGAPGTIKSFRRVEVELATPLPTGAAVTVGFLVDSQASPVVIPLTANAQGNLVGYFPYPTKGYRVQILIAMQSTASGAAGTSPVIRSISVKATLGRAWKATVSCQRNQRLRNQFTAGDDAQGLRAQDLLANIQNAYQQVSGQVTLFIPSPTSANGVEQVQAELEDYTWTAYAEPGPYTTEYGSLDMEGTVDLTLVESL